VNPEKDRLVKGGDCRQYSDKQIPGREGQGSANLRAVGPLEGGQRYAPGDHRPGNHAGVISKKLYQVHFHIVTKVLPYNRKVSSSSNILSIRYSKSASTLQQLETKVISNQTIMSRRGQAARWPPG
jgi:hypothetical protein